MPGIFTADEDAKQRAFDTVFAHFDPQDTGYINSKDFLDLIDHLDALQPEEAEPIISERQRADAQQFGDSDMKMTRAEVLDFLTTLGVVMRSPKDHESEKHDAQSEQDFDATSPLMHARPRSALLSERPRPANRLSRSVSSQAATQAFQMDPNNNTFDHSRFEDLSRAHGTNTPLAQSTPNGKENRRPGSSPQKSIHNKTIYSALGEGAFSPSSSTRAREDEYSFDIDEMVHLRDQVRMLQERERLSERAIATNEDQIHSLEALLSDYRTEAAKNNRTVAELRADRKTAEQDIAMLEKNVEQVSKQLQQVQDKHDKVKSNLELHMSESADTQAALADSVGQVEELRAEILVLESDRKMMSSEKRLLQSQITKLEAQCDALRDTESQLCDALNQCNEFEDEIRRLKHDLDQVKQASLRQARNDLRALEAHKESTPDEAEQEARLEQLRLASVSRQNLVCKSTQTLDDDLDSRSGSSTIKHDLAVAQEEALKQRYASLSNELGLQKSLIEQMLKMKPALKKSRLKASRTSSISSSSSPSAAAAAARGLPVSSSPRGEEESSTARLASMSKTPWIMLGPLIVLYSLVFLFLGYLIASQRSIQNAPGVSYAELRSWERANALDYMLDHHGVLGNQPYHWYEGRWRWLEMAGYWMQEKLQDRPWPS